MKASMKAGAALCLAGMAAGANAQNTYTLPLVMAADSAGLTGFVRIVNRTERSGSVQIHAIDDTGARFGPVSLSVGAAAVAGFNSGDLERGNASRGLSSGVGDGSGHWRLELTTALDIQPLAYIRTVDGFVTAMHDIAPVSGMEHAVLFFNPGSNARQVSRLRLANPGTAAAQVTVEGRDDAGDVASGTVRLTLPAGAARTLTAQALEAGGEGFDGSLGDGAGKWRLSVTSSQVIEVMSLLQSPTGHLANLSTAPVHVGVAPTVAVGCVDDAAFNALTLGKAAVIRWTTAPLGLYIQRAVFLGGDQVRFELSNGSTIVGSYLYRKLAPDTAILQWMAIGSQCDTRLVCTSPTAGSWASVCDGEFVGGAGTWELVDR